MMKPRLYILALAICSYICNAQNAINFNETDWDLSNGRILEFDGRTCISGNTVLKDPLFTNAVVEFDLWTDGNRSFPGFYFRDQGDGNFETFYLRTHRMGLYSDALQYAPVYNGMTCWQLYHGEGYCTSAPVMRDRWIHIKAEINQDEARFYLDHAEDPTLTARLVREVAAGNLGLNTWNDHTYISNLSIQVLPDSPQTSKEQSARDASGTGWEISRLLDAKRFDSDTYPDFYTIHDAHWEKVTSDAKGLVNITQHRRIEKGAKNCVYARKAIYSEKDQTVRIHFGYSDAVKFFFNEKLIYSGDYAFLSRSDSFSGTIGTYDSYYIDLKKGLNEIFLVLKEDFGGWGFIINCETPLEGPPVAATQATRAWSTPERSFAPESAVYDPEEKMIYFTNFDTQFWKHDEPTGYISKVSVDGEIINERWVEGIDAPTGICRFGRKLYVVERSSVVEISIADGVITQRYPFPDGIVFANDLVADDEGKVYITHSAGNPNPDIYILKDGHIEPWLTTDQISNLNAIYFDGDSIVIGDCYHNLLRRIDLATQHISTIISMGSGVIDGIKKDREGNFLISLWRGELYRIDSSGKLTQILNTDGKFNIADFEYIPDTNTVAIPAFMSRNLEVFELE